MDKRFTSAAALLAFALCAACEAPQPARAGAEPAAISSPGAALLGLQVRDLPESARKALGVAYGVIVTRVLPPADRSRILPGDVIVGVNDKRIHSMEEFNRLVGERPNASVALLVRRTDSDLYIMLDEGGIQRGHYPRGTPLRT